MRDQHEQDSEFPGIIEAEGLHGGLSKSRLSRRQSGKGGTQVLRDVRHISAPKRLFTFSGELTDVSDSRRKTVNRS